MYVFFRVYITGLHKWVSYMPSHFKAEQGVVKNYFTLRGDPSLKIAKWNLILSCALPPPGLRKTQCMFVHLNPLPFNLSGL